MTSNENRGTPHNPVPGAENVVRLVGRWDPGDVCFISGLEILARSSTTSCVRMVAVLQRRDLALKGWPDKAVPSFRVEFVCDSAVNMELRDFGHGHKQVSGFDIVDVEADQLDGIRFLVHDYENGSIRFCCKDIRIVNVSAL